MATYKVIQDVEAEDKLIGPLTLRQFIYAAIAAVLGYLTFLAATKGAAFIGVIFLPFIGAFGFLAWPWSRDQPTEIWALAKIRFLVKPRKRIWNQSGMKELVTITAPKKIERHLTNGLSQTEVTSRLQALADTIDSRGWVIKNVGINLYSQPAFAGAGENSSDRLVSIESLPQTVATIDVRPDEDMLDEKNNRLAHEMEDRLNESAKAHRQRLVDRLRSKKEEPATAAPAVPPAPAQQPQQPANNYWFLNQPTQTASNVPQDMVTFNTQLVAPGSTPQDAPAVQAAVPTADEAALLQQLASQQKQQVSANSHLHTIQPLSAQPVATSPMPPAMQPAAALPWPPPATPATTANQPMSAAYGQPPQPTAPAPAPQPVQQQVTQVPDAAILDLARNDDLNVATIAREAHKRRDLPQDEVVISLH